MKLRNFLAITAMSLLAAACSHPGEGGAGTPNVNINAVAQPLRALVPNVTIGAFQSYQISSFVSGGVPPYHYQLQAGVGFVDYSAGTFQAGSASCTPCVVSISDSSGQSTTLDITVIGSAASGTPTPAPMPQTTNCSAMLNNLHLAAVDTSANGVGSALGAVNLTDPSACSAWCGEQNAGYCLWSPGGDGSVASNPVCIAWPGGITLNTYQTTWNVYSGTCQ